MATPNPATTEWVPIWQPQGVIAGGGGGAMTPHHITHETGGSDAVVHLAGEVIDTGTVARARLVPQVAYEDENNVWVANNTFQAPVTFNHLTTFAGTGLNSPTFTSVRPTLLFFETDMPVNQRKFILNIDGGSLAYQGADDALNVIGTYFTITASGIVVGSGGVGQIYGDGVGITNINASNLTHGLANPVRLGNGTPSANTFLRGDSTWQTIPGGLPSGLIAMFSTNCPFGWTRVSGLDGKFPRGASSWGATGGTTNHSHGVGGSIGNAGGHAHSATLLGSGSGSGKTSFLTNNNIGANFASNTSFANSVHEHDFSVTINVSVSGNTDGVGDHSHSFSGSADTQDHIPPYVNVVYCMKD